MADTSVSRVVAAGFDMDVAQWALKNNRNDVGAAIRELRAVSSCGDDRGYFKPSGELCILYIGTQQDVRLY